MNKPRPYICDIKEELKESYGIEMTDREQTILEVFANYYGLDPYGER